MTKKFLFEDTANTSLFPLQVLDRLSPLLHESAILGEAAIMKWGREAQVDKAIEELAELTVALMQFKQQRVPVSAVHDEVADVFKMTLRLAALFGLGETFDAIERKSERLRLRLLVEAP